MWKRAIPFGNQAWAVRCLRQQKKGLKNKARLGFTVLFQMFVGSKVQAISAMKILKSILPFLFLSAVGLNAQFTLEISKGCNSFSPVTDGAGTPMTFEPSAEAEERVNFIVEAAGAPANFQLRCASFEHLYATRSSADGKRYLTYATSFLEKFDKRSTYWGAYFLLAHEIGHHLKRHDFEEKDPNHLKYNELEADVFAGSALRALGATLEEAKEALNQLPKMEKTETRPSKSSRIEAMILGWNRHDKKINLEGTTDSDYPVADIFQQFTQNTPAIFEEHKEKMALEEAKRREIEKHREMTEAKRREIQLLADTISQASGTWGKPGNTGVPTSTGDNPFGKSSGTGGGTGGGEGAGTGVSVGGGLGGRAVVQRGRINDSSQKSGKVVIEVCVNSSGSVISAEYTQRGSTTADSELRTQAIQAARSYRYAASSIDRECGTITFNFQANPHTLPSPVIYSTQNKYDQMPNFPWPPPNCFQRKTLVKNLSAKAHNFRDIDDRLQRALDAEGYFQRSYYQTPGGFALVTQMEQFDEDGSIKKRFRWTNYPVQDDFNDVWEYFKSLIMPTPGRFRVFVFVVTDQAYPISERRISALGVQSLAAGGFSQMPSAYSQTEITSSHYLEVLIYEFEAPQSTKKCTEKCPAFLDVQTHLLQSRLSNVIDF